MYWRAFSYRSFKTRMGHSPQCRGPYQSLLGHSSTIIILSLATSLRAPSFGGMGTQVDGLRLWTSHNAKKPITSYQLTHRHYSLRHLASAQGEPRQYVQADLSDSFSLTPAGWQNYTTTPVAKSKRYIPLKRSYSLFVSFIFSYEDCFERAFCLHCSS